MSIVQRKNFKCSSGEHLDDGILLSKALKLIENSDYYDDLIEIFHIEDIKNDFIEIKGARTLVNRLIEADEECEKIDIDCQLSNVQLHKYTDDDEISIEILGIDNKSILLQDKKDRLLAKSTYSVKSEYLGVFGVDKYFEQCQKNNFTDIIDANISMLNEKTESSTNEKKFRLLRTNDDVYYIRAITSVDVYKDYNLRLSLFIALIELHRLGKNKEYSFFVSSYSLNESNMNVIFKSDKEVIISDDTKIGFAIELVNDEIRRDALKFNGVFTVFIGDMEIYAKQEDTKKSNIISLPHKGEIDKLKGKLCALNEGLHNYIIGTIDDAKKIKVLSKPDLLREHLLLKIRNSKHSEFNQLYRKQMQTLLSNKVNTIFELAAIFKKIDILIEDEHISSLDFWRYKLCQVLMDEVKKN